MKVLLLLVIFSSSTFGEYLYLRDKAKKSGIELTEKEKDILLEGRVDSAQYVIGGILGTYPLGLGIGHAIQGRYSTDGWKFTVGELASLAVVVTGLNDCVEDLFEEDDCNDGLITIGAIGFVGFRIWEIIDLWATPLKINRKYDFLKNYIESSEKPKITYQISPIVNKEGNLGLGLNIKF